MRIWKDGHTLRTSWGHELSWGLSGPQFSLHQFHYESHTLAIGMIFFTIYLQIPLIFKDWRIFENLLGFSFTASGIHWGLGKKTHIIYYPWDWNHYSTHEAIEVEGWFKSEPTTRIWAEITNNARNGVVATKHEFDYTYVLRNGTVQKRKAKVYVAKMEWRWKWFGLFLPWPRKKRQYIDVTFDDEVGERTGSWKGGTVGCSENQLPGETPEQTLFRMQMNRKF